MKRRSFIKLAATGTASVAATSFLTACGQGSGDTTSGSNAATTSPLALPPTLRVVNLINGVQLSVSAINSATGIELPLNYGNIAFSTVSARRVLEAGVQYALSVYDTTNLTQALMGVNVTLKPGHTLTLVLFREGNCTSAALLNETTTPEMATDKFVMAAVSTVAATTSLTYDAYLTPPLNTLADLRAGDSTDIAAAMANVVGVRAGNLSTQSAQTAAGNYRLRLTRGTGGGGPASAKVVVFDSGTNGINFQGGANGYTLLCFSQGSATLPTVLLLQSNTDTVQLIPNQLANVRIVQGSPNITSSDVMIGNGTMVSTTFSQLPFGACTNYALVFAASTAPNVSVAFTDISNNPQTPRPYLTYTNTTLQGGRDYAIYSIGSTAGTTPPNALLVQDWNQPNQDNFAARIYAVNALPQNDIDPKSGLATAQVDLFLNAQRIRHAISAQTAPNSDGYAVTYPGYDTITFTTDGNTLTPIGPTINSGGTTNVTVNGVIETLFTPTLTYNGVYTIALIGAQGTYLPVVFQTNQTGTA